MAAALRAAEGGVYFFQILRGGGGVFSKFFRPGGVYPPTPPIPDPCSKGGTGENFYDL